MPERLVGGRRIAWREGGSGEPALLLHCGLAHSGAWGPLMARLGDRLAMRALDLPGHGGTDWDPSRDIQDQAVEDARAMLADTGPAHLVGHSFGGTVALRVGVEAPGTRAQPDPDRAGDVRFPRRCGSPRLRGGDRCGGAVSRCGPCR
jgi:pimeloyl-ACP methyl ester carboxylesterase